MARMTHPLLPPMQSLIDARIEEARLRGEFDNLPGAGRPLPEEDLSVPEELRLANRILKNAGFVPPELDERREAVELAGLLATIDDEGERRRAAARLTLLEIRREAAGAGSGLPAPYRGALLAKLAR